MQAFSLFDFPVFGLIVGNSSSTKKGKDRGRKDGGLEGEISLAIFHAAP